MNARSLQRPGPLSGTGNLLFSVLLIGSVNLALATCTPPDSTSTGAASTSTSSAGITSPGTQSPNAAPASSTSQQAAAPVFRPAAGMYASVRTVTITSGTPGASIRYTTDGSAPTATVGTEYSTPIRVETSQTLKAIAYKAGFVDSIVATAVYSIGGGIATPSFSPDGGTYSSDQSVVLRCATTGAAIHYTTDGSTPTGDSPLYTAPLAVAGNGTVQTIKAIAIAEMAASTVQTATYTISSRYQSVGTLGSGAGNLKFPAGLAVDSLGRIYVADRGNNRIVRMDDMSGANWTTFAGTVQSDHAGSTTPFKNPTGVAIDAQGRILVADQGNGRIVRMDDMKGSGWTAFGSIGTGANQFKNPAGVALDSQGGIYVADQGNSRIVFMGDVKGTGWTTFGVRGSGSNQFKDPAAVALDAGGHIYVADYANNRIVRIDDMKGTAWTSLGKSGAAASQFRYPTGILVDPSGRIVVDDMANSRIVRVDDMSGANWTVIDADLNEFNHPWGVAADAAGEIYVADMLNNRIVHPAAP